MARWPNPKTMLLVLVLFAGPLLFYALGAPGDQLVLEDLAQRGDRDNPFQEDTRVAASTGAQADTSPESDAPDAYKNPHVRYGRPSGRMFQPRYGPISRWRPPKTSRSTSSSELAANTGDRPDSSTSSPLDPVTTRGTIHEDMSIDLSPTFAVTPGTYLPPGTSINPLRSTDLDEFETSGAMRSRQEIPSVWLDNGNAKDRAVVTTSGEEPASAVPLNTFRVDVVAPPKTLEAHDEPRNILDNTVQAELAEAAQPPPSAIPSPVAEKKTTPQSTDDFSKQLARAAQDSHPSKPPTVLPGPAPAAGPGVEIPTLSANPAPIIADVTPSTPDITLPSETDLSAELFQEAEEIAQDAKSVDDLSRVIQLCRQTGETTVAIELLEAAQRLAAWAYNRRGELHLAADRLTDAIDDFKAAIELDPECWLAYHNRAVTYAERGQNKAALKDFQRVIELYPALGIAYRNRAELLASIGQTADAIPDYNRALEQFPDDLELLLSRGHAFHRLGKYRQALADFDAVIQSDAKHAEAYSFRGNAYAELSDFERAQEDFEKSIELLPNQSEAYRSLAWMMAACPDPEFRNPDRAVETAKLSQKYGQPGDFLVLETLAAAYASNEQFDRAARFQEQAIAMAPKDIDTEDMKDRLALYEERQPFHHEETGEVRPASLEEPWPVIIDDQP